MKGALRFACLAAVTGLALSACSVTPRGDWSNSRRAPTDQTPRMPDTDQRSLTGTVAPEAGER